jgi:alpha-glucoside transport system substrate-binding protein
MTTTIRKTVPLLAVLALTASACLGGGGGGGGAEGEAGTVNVLHAFTEPADQAGYDAMVAAFEESSGHTVESEPTSSLDETALTRVEGGDPPDIIFHPQPGLLEDLVERGAPRPLDFLDTAQLEEDLVAGLVDLGTFDGEFYGLQAKLQLKSLVWYPQDNFEEAGFEIPESYDALIELSDQIASETDAAPWCIGIESAQATGWVATDWIEDLMLRLHGPETYDAWVQHEVLFDSPEVTEAYEHLEEIWFNEDFVLGGTQNILATGFGESPLPMFEDPAACYLHRQASFIQANFPEEEEYGQGYDFFPFPSVGEADSDIPPGLIAGDLAALYTDNPAAQDFIEFLTTTEAQEAWAAEGSYLCSLKGCDPSVYPNEAFARQGEFLSEAPFVRFDGSDLMPGQVGAGAFWSETVAWIAGQQDLQTTLSNIDAAWPEGEEGESTDA